MRYKFSLSPKIKGYVEWQLEHYHEDKRQLEEYKRDLLPSATQKLSFTAGCSNGTSSPTENTAIKLATDTYILTTERNIAAIEKALSRCDHIDLKIIELFYWRQTHTVVGAGMKIGLSQGGAYKRLNKILCAVALEMGLINL